MRGQLNSRTEKAAGQEALRIDALIAYIAQISKISQKQSVNLKDIVERLQGQEDAMGTVVENNDYFESLKVLRCALHSMEVWHSTFRALENVIAKNEKPPR